MLTLPLGPRSAANFGSIALHPFDHGDRVGVGLPEDGEHQRRLAVIVAGGPGVGDRVLSTRATSPSRTGLPLGGDDDLAEFLGVLLRVGLDRRGSGGAR